MEFGHRQSTLTQIEAIFPSVRDPPVRAYIFMAFAAGSSLWLLRPTLTSILGYCSHNPS